VTDAHTTKNVTFKPNYLVLVFVLEILINFVTEHTIDEDRKTIHIKDSFKHYLRRKFWFDTLTIVGITGAMTVDLRQFTKNLAIFELQKFVKTYGESDE
jgi:hypothetical protein